VSGSHPDSIGVYPPNLGLFDLTSGCRRFHKYLTEYSENIHGERSTACIAVTQFHVDLVLGNGPPAEKFDSGGDAWVDLISVDEDEGYQSVGLSYLFPRAYSLLELGWHQIAVGNEDVFAN
jgi:hypothetical protein